MMVRKLKFGGGGGFVGGTFASDIHGLVVWYVEGLGMPSDQAEMVGRLGAGLIVTAMVVVPGWFARKAEGD